MKFLPLLVLLVACKKDDKPAAPPPKDPLPPAETAPAMKPPEPPPVATPDAAVAAPVTAADPACTERATQLEKRMREVAAATPGLMPLVKNVNAPESEAGKGFDERGFVLAVAKDGTASVRGDKFRSSKEAGPWLDAMNKTGLERLIMDGGSLRDAKLVLYIWPDRDTPASTIAELLAVATENGSNWVPRLVVARKAGPASGEKLGAPIAAIAAKVPAAEPESTTYVAGQMKTAGGQCSEVITPFAADPLAGTPAKGTEKLLKEVTIGLMKCNCKVSNPDLFDWSVAAYFGATAPALAWVEMPMIDKAEKRTIGKLIAK